ncbi:M24 family metallopeptidase [Natronomonas sp.]|uniref:M24 family metallopeptidase n=1 Tax=Natronomonas sp. TaxID=2184060 RepID=UPI003974A84C
MTSLNATVFERRLKTIRERIRAEAVDAGVWFDATAIEYLVDFPHVVTERPVVLVVTENAARLVVPRLERDRAEAIEHVDAVDVYFDYPAERPMGVLEETLTAIGASTVAADADAPPAVMGYEGAPLSSIVSVVEQSWVRKLRREKSPAVRELLVESARWADRVHDRLVSLVRTGASPIVVSERAMTDGTELLIEELGTAYDVRTRFRGPVLAGVVSGEWTARPHAYTTNEPLSAGDPIITGVVVDVGGYMAELERTLFVAEASPEQREYFNIVCEAQSKAIDAIEPGVALEHVDGIARDHFQTRGVLEYVAHHTGHAIGMEIHEPPYIDRGSDAVVRPGDVYAVEPALYTGDAGYRHSDTVIVKSDGGRRITETPRSIEANVVGE